MSPGKASLRVAAPSDPDRGQAHWGGRIRTARDPQGRTTLWLEDAAERLITDLDAGAAEESDLVVINARRCARRLSNCRVIERRRPESPGGNETARLLDQGVGRKLYARQRAKRVVRTYFEEQGFWEVDTPALVPSPGLDLHLEAFEIANKDKQLYLSTSPEYQMKRLLVGGVPRCYQLCHAYRGDEQGTHHNREFTMLEWYRAFAHVDEVIRDTEALISRVCSSTDGAALGDWNLSRPFERISVREAFARYARVDENEMLRLSVEDNETFFRILIETIEPGLCAERRPMILERYPRSMASLARLCPDDSHYAERFEVYLAGVELCNGFGELVDPVEQSDRFAQDQRERAKAQLPVYPSDQRFLEALQAGMPYAAGNALGFDRLVMLATGADSLAEVMAFPVSEL